MTDSKLILVGGTSHVGKSTLGRRLAEEAGWDYLSTDRLSRHPGRPWKVYDHQVPEEVAEHYANLSAHQLLDSVLSHYRNNVWPIIEAIVQSRLNNPFDLRLVIEGSAILPELVKRSATARVSSIWLTAPRQLIAERIRSSSNYADSTVAERQLIDAFLERTIAFDSCLKDSAAGGNQWFLDVSSPDTFEKLRSMV